MIVLFKNIKSYVFKAIAKYNKFFLNPIFIFVVLLILCVASIILWVIWYINQHDLIGKIGKDLSFYKFNDQTSLIFLISGITVLVVILIGTIFLFVFAIKQKRLIAHQKSFLSSVTHELRSPLTSLQLSLETLNTRDFPKEIKDKLHDMILLDIERLTQLIDEILVSSRLDRGIAMFDNIGQFTIKEIIIESIARVSRNKKNKLKNVSIECPDDLFLEISKPALILIISNIIENALKYSPEGAPIRIIAQEEDKNILLAIKDQGFGLEKKEYRSIFKMFHRGASAEKKAIAGTGLGLYIVRSILNTLGGKIWVESKGTGKGTTFFLFLPITQKDNI